MDRAVFFNECRSLLFGEAMSVSQVAGCNAILDAFAAHAPKSDPRFIAYALATAFHETARQMQPIREFGFGRGRPYGAATGRWDHAYYGRGLVQLTWEHNYQHATARLAALKVIDPAQVDFDREPDLALRPEYAAAIMVFGMIEGWFTGRSLGQYFVGTRSDWIDARSIINPHDCAAKIAGYGLHFYHALTSAQAKAA